MREISGAERVLCESLRPHLAPLPVGGVIGQSAEAMNAIRGLDWFVQEVLAEIHPEWKGEGIDDIYPAAVRKTGDDEVEIVGVCCLIRDQTLTPMHVRLQLNPREYTVSWLECRLGESTADGMHREPHSLHAVERQKLRVVQQMDTIDWAYHVGYGERRP
jgi:hypothetical protein